MPDLLSAARTALAQCLGARRGEKMLVITDEPLRSIGYAFFEAGREAGCETLLLEILPRRNSGEPPPEPVPDFWKRFDCFVAPTSRSLTHTRARKEATEAGVRGATLPGITPDTMARCLSADYHAIAERSERLAALLSRGKTARVTTPAGTDITLSIEGRQGIADTGILTDRGAFGNLPAGEAFLAPVEGTAEGTIVVDGSVGDSGALSEPITLVVAGGYVTEIRGDKSGQLEKLLAPHGRDAYSIAELGIGTNDRARIVGNVLEDEKVLGTVHIAVGNNAFMGGKVNVPSHHDAVLRRPDLFIDGKAIMRAGEIL
ncbi:MAG TPA: aminopeptidase [Candidatus Polarisedimenticolia bacterium]|jgi:leucyl aminopeptidase (aminopeptidase T)|nr:aminopeptidase [Candidatus Polarisedimenticolia bacterium]